MHAVYISVSDGRTTPVIGQSYNLTCNVSGTTFTAYQWRKDGSVISDETGATLTFSPLTRSDAGQYSCGNSELFSNNKTLILEGIL